MQAHVLHSLDLSHLIVEFYESFLLRQELKAQTKDDYQMDIDIEDGDLGIENYLPLTIATGETDEESWSCH